MYRKIVEYTCHGQNGGSCQKKSEKYKTPKTAKRPQKVAIVGTALFWKYPLPKERVWAEGSVPRLSSPWPITPSSSPVAGAGGGVLDGLGTGHPGAVRPLPRDPARPVAEAATHTIRI